MTTHEIISAKETPTPDPSTPGEVERLVDVARDAILILPLTAETLAEATGEVDEVLDCLIARFREALSHITAARPEGAGDLARQAYDLGFAASGEGWNGEYPHDAAETESYARSRAEDLARLLNKPAATNPQDQE